MTKNPSWKLLEVFVLIITKVPVIRIHISKWELRRGMRILVLIIPQMIRIHFSGWAEVVART